MTASYVLTSATEADLRAIIRYTNAHWGEAQTRSYMALKLLVIVQKHGLGVLS